MTEATEEIAYLQRLLRTNGNADVNSIHIASYLDTQSARFRRMGLSAVSAWIDTARCEWDACDVAGALSALKKAKAYTR